MQARHAVLAWCGAAALALTPASASALSLISSFDPSEAGALCSIGFGSSTVWVYQCSASTVQSYSTAGVLQASFARPGESANDVDIDVAPVGFTLGGAAIPAGSVLFINGETDAAEVYGLDTSGTLLTVLGTEFGASHVVGGAYHVQRGTLFLVQDEVPAAADDNLIAEVDAQTGEVLNTLATDVHSGYTVNFGDLDVHTGTGNLFVVSSDQTSILELTPTGGFVALHALPTGVTSLSGIALDEASGEIWVSGTGGTVWRLGGLPVPEPRVLALLAIGGVLLARRSSRR
jgi:hypothetical protein